MGSGKNAKIILGITLGTGLGGGLIEKIGNKISVYRGAFNSAGEFGHMTIKFDGPKCSCGNYGCLEEYVSKRFIIRESGYPEDKIIEKSRKKDKKIVKVYQKLGKNLGIGLANLINILDPEVIIIGGGISKSASLFLKEAKKEFKRRTYSPSSKKLVKIKLSKLGEFSGAIGAALLFKIHD